MQRSPIGKIRKGRPALVWETYIKKAVEARGLKAGE
jgi:hypothetical protein